MSDNDDDITRIEDLSDFIHDEDEDIDISLPDDQSSSQENTSFLEMEKESFGDNTSFIQIPAELDDTNEQEDFNETDEHFSTTDDFDEQTQTSEFESFTPEESFESEALTEFPQGDGDFGPSSEELSLVEDSPLESFNEEETPIEPKLDQLPVIEEDVIPAKPIEAPKNYSPPEDFRDINDVANTMNFTDLSIEGNPPYSIIISEIKYTEDVEEVLELLQSYKLIKPEYLNDTKKSLMRGALLIPRLSEYSAITLCHKLRRFDLNIQMDLSKKLHDSSSYESIDHGLVSKTAVLSNKKVMLDLTKESISLDSIQVSSEGSICGFQILHHENTIEKELVLDPEQNIDLAKKELLNIIKQEAQKNSCNAVLNLQFRQEHNIDHLIMKASANLVRVTRDASKL